MKQPIAVSMLIPGCNSGKLLNRGGAGGVCDRQGGCSLSDNMFRECTNSPLLT